MFWIVCFPLSVLWAVVTTVRRRWYPARERYRSRFPVLSVGNLHSGGSGKTPLVAAILGHFADDNPIVVSRGYGGSLTRSGAKVDLGHANGPAAFGDEPWMLARRWGATVWIGRNRTQSVQQIEQSTASAKVILDDGFQHLALHRDLDLVLIHARHEVSASFCLPLGELREPLGALRHAHAVVLVRTGAPDFLSEWETYLEEAHPSLPCFKVTTTVLGVSDGKALAPLSSLGKVGGFCGIASPEGFSAFLKNVPDGRLLHAFPDHHVYSEKDVTDMLEKKQRLGLERLLTTDKDWDKASPLFAARGEGLLSLRIGYEISNEFWYFLQHRWVRK